MLILFLAVQPLLYPLGQQQANQSAILPASGKLKHTRGIVAFKTILGAFPHYAKYCFCLQYGKTIKEMHTSNAKASAAIRGLALLAPWLWNRHQL